MYEVKSGFIFHIHMLVSFVNFSWMKVMFWSSCIYFFIGLYVFYQLFSKTTGPNCMKFLGMICHHPRTNQIDFGSDKVKVKETKVSKPTGPNCMKFSGLICHHSRTNRLDFVNNQVKGQGQGHEKVKNLFLS